METVTSLGAVSLFPCHKPEFPHWPQIVMTAVNRAGKTGGHRATRGEGECDVCMRVCEGGGDVCVHEGVRVCACVLVRGCGVCKYECFSVSACA